MNTAEQYHLLFRVGGQWYGVELGKVIEVLYFVGLSELPSAPPDVLGMLTLRDMVFPVVDLRRRFGLPDSSLTLDTPIIALNINGERVGWAVDEADNVIVIPEEAFVPYRARYMVSSARLEQRGLIFLLDTEQLRAEVVYD